MMATKHLQAVAWVPDPGMKKRSRTIQFSTIAS